MKERTLTIIINKPIEEVFKFTLDPVNTPRWVDTILKEETNEIPTRLGTIYRNQNIAGEWSEYVVTEFEKNKIFVLTHKGSSYSVKYTFSPTGPDSVKLDYFESVNEGKIEAPFTQNELEKLKVVIEAT